jgi:5-methylcytosine-specific restriction endonuclease McrA
MGRHRSGHRVPPRPPFINTSKPGQCKFCGDPIITNGRINRRASWHPQCALRWTIMNSPRDARRFVFVRDRGICKECNKNCSPNNGNPDTVARIIEQIMSPPSDQHHKQLPTMPLGMWELDHVIPLSQAQRMGNPPHLWQLSNMQTLCPPCHVIKTKQDRVLYGTD